MTNAFVFCATALSLGAGSQSRADPAGSFRFTAQQKDVLQFRATGFIKGTLAGVLTVPGCGWAKRASGAIESTKAPMAAPMGVYFRLSVPPIPLDRRCNLRWDNEGQAARDLQGRGLGGFPRR